MEERGSGTTYGLSDKGWVDTQLFQGWLTGHFLPNAVGSCPLLLLLHGHSSHYQLISYAKEHNNIVPSPPHTTHDSQPLDANVFKPLKQNWQDVYRQYVQDNPGRVVTKYQFSELLKEAWQRTMIPSIIIAGFRRCGVFPLDPDAIDCSVSASNPEATLQLQNQNGDDEGDMRMQKKSMTVVQSERARHLSRTATVSVVLKRGMTCLMQNMRWLRIHHPDSLPSDGEARLPNLPLDELHDDDRQESLADLYSSLRPASPLTMTNGPEMEVSMVSAWMKHLHFPSLPLGSGGTHEPTTPSLWYFSNGLLTNNFRMH